MSQGANASYFRTLRDAVWARDDLGLPSLVVALRLVEYWPRIFPAVATLARDCRLSERAVQRALRDLESKGIIRTTRRDQTSSVYQFLNAAGLPIEVTTLGAPQSPGGAPQSPGGAPQSPPPGEPQSPEADPDLKQELKRRSEAGPRTTAPDSFEPVEAHRFRCQELKIDIDDLLKSFKLQEFNRAYSDWPRRFSKWIEDEKLRRETDKAKSLGKKPKERTFADAMKDCP